MTRVQVPVPMLLDTRVLVLVSAWCLSHQHPKKTASENIDGRVYAYTWTIVNDGSVRTGALMGEDRAETNGEHFWCQSVI